MTLLPPRKELLNLHRRIYLKQKKQIDESVQHTDRAFRAYERRYLKGVSAYQKIVEIDEVTVQLLDADIIYIGDYHTLNQSQRSLMRVLRTLIPRSHQFVLAIEVIHEKHQPLLDAFMKGKFGDKAFLKKSGFYKHWFFDLWDNFKPIFDFCKYHQIPLKALEAAGDDESLKKRDVAMARRIFDIHRQNMDKKIIVFVGDLHLARSHLPLEVEKIFKKENEKIKTLTLFQNSEAIYWKLAQMGLEHKTDVVQISPNEYCRLHTPPIIAQQSYLNWLEHEDDVLDFADAKATFLNYLDQMASFLNLTPGAEKDEVEVYTCGDLSFLKKLRESSLFSNREIVQIKKQILQAESYYIPKLKLVYLANMSINHTAEEASHTLKHLLSGDEFPRLRQDAFYAAILHEALGFFGSKIINPKRKCSRSSDYKNLIHYLESQDIIKNRLLEYETAVLFLEHEKRGIKRKPFSNEKIKSFSPDLFFSLLHALGYSLGEKLFYGLLADVITREEIAALFLNPMKGQGEPLQIYQNLVKKLKPVKLPRKI